EDATTEGLDLSLSLPETGRQADVAAALNTLLDRTAAQITDTMGSALRLSETAPTLADLARTGESQSTALSDAANHIAAASEEMTTTLEQEITPSTEELARYAGQVTGLVDASHRRGEAIARHMSDLDTRLQALESQVDALQARTSEVSEVVGLISRIAGQTNILALNAAIEAARAGQYGQGFAVVAEEVRQLAQQTGEATGRVSGVIEGLTTGMEETGSAAESVRAGLTESQADVTTTLDELDSARQAMADLDSRSQRISTAMHQMNTTTQG
ncbi:methyl-accepting chemotaxis protein, partial [Arhodomonas sp. KWT]